MFFAPYRSQVEWPHVLQTLKQGHDCHKMKCMSKKKLTINTETEKKTEEMNASKDTNTSEATPAEPIMSETLQEDEKENDKQNDTLAPVQKKHHIRFILLIVFAFGLGLFFYLHHQENKDKLTYVKAMGKFTTDFIECIGPLETEVGFREIWNQEVNGNCQIDYSLNVTGVTIDQDSVTEELKDALSQDAEKELLMNLVTYIKDTTIGLDGTVRRDVEKQKLSATVSASVMNRELADAQMYADAQNTYFQIPFFMEDMVATKHEGISAQWDPFYTLLIPDDNPIEYVLTHTKELTECYNTAVVTNLNVRREVPMEENQQTTCDDYDVVLRCEPLMDSFPVPLPEEMHLLISLDAKDKIRYMESVEPVQVYGQMIRFQMSFMGDEVPMKSMSVTMHKEKDDDRNQSVDLNGTMGFMRDGLGYLADLEVVTPDHDYTLAYEGYIAEHEKAKSMNIMIRDCRVSIDGRKLGKITGSYEIKGNGEEISMPKDFLQIDEMDEEQEVTLHKAWLQNLGLEVEKYVNAFDYLQSFSLFK